MVNDLSESWNPDNKFIDFFLNELRSNGVDLDQKVLCCPDGTKKGGEGRSYRETAEEMREGTEFGRMMHEGFRKSYIECGEYTPSE
ncbi:MAG: hypothetical protein AABW89_05585 [Nanoarchaeota archaeon]